MKAPKAWYQHPCVLRGTFVMVEQLNCRMSHRCRSMDMRLYSRHEILDNQSRSSEDIGIHSEICEGASVSRTTCQDGADDPRLANLASRVYKKNNSTTNSTT